MIVTQHCEIFLSGKVLNMLEKIGNQEAVSSLLDIISDNKTSTTSGRELTRSVPVY